MAQGRRPLPQSKDRIINQQGGSHTWKKGMFFNVRVWKRSGGCVRRVRWFGWLTPYQAAVQELALMDLPVHKYWTQTWTNGSCKMNACTHMSRILHSAAIKAQVTEPWLQREQWGLPYEAAVQKSQSDGFGSAVGMKTATDGSWTSCKSAPVRNWSD